MKEKKKNSSTRTFVQSQSKYLLFRRKSKGGFSLAEVLMATGVLALGMAFIAGVFPAGLNYTILSTERTMSAVVADEAFAKIRLYGVDDVNLPPLGLPLQGCSEILTDSYFHRTIPQIEFGYPSAASIPLEEKTYYWSAICRRISGTAAGQTLVQVTVFVSRKTMANIDYYLNQAGSPVPGGSRPAAVQIQVTGQANSFQLTINNTNYRTYIPVPSTIVEDFSGRIYRVIDRDSSNPSIIILDKPWQDSLATSVWVVPPPVGGGRYPCVGVFQKEMLF